MINSLREQIIRDEGMRLKPYKDTVGKLTIGVGRNLEDVGISLTEAEVMLDHDISRITAQVISYLPWTVKLDEARREVLINMAFMGIGKLLKFEKMLAALQQDDYSTAAKELLDSKYHEQVGLRAERLAEQLLTGERQ